MRSASFTIGFEIPHMGNDFFRRVVEGASTSSSASGYRLIIAPGLGHLSGTSVVDALVDRKVDGITVTSDGVTVEWLEHLAEAVPLVHLGSHDRSRGYDTATNDADAGTNLVMDNLLGLGHQRITHLTVSALSDRALHAVRLQVYRQRLQRAGYSPQAVYVDTGEDGTYELAAHPQLQPTDPSLIATPMLKPRCAHDSGFQRVQPSAGPDHWSASAGVAYACALSMSKGAVAPIGSHNVGDASRRSPHDTEVTTSDFER